MKLITIFYWVSVFALVHSYFIYPLYRWLRFKQLENAKPEAAKKYQEKSKRRISVILSAFNEEACILDKLDNLFELEYPKELINFYVGSDGSFDNTNDLIMLSEIPKK